MRSEQQRSLCCAVQCCAFASSQDQQMHQQMHSFRGGGEIEELRGGGVASLVPAGSRAQLSGQGHAQE